MQVNFSSGSLFEYSKEPADGFVEHTNKEGVHKGYRRYHDRGVTGELISVNERTNEYLNDQKELVVVLKDGEDYLHLNFTVYNIRNSFSSFAEDIIKALPDLKLGTVYTVNPYNFVPKDSDSDRPIVGVSFKAGKEKALKLQQKYVKKDGTVTEGDIPQVTWSEKRGKMIPDEEAKTDYLYDVYMAQIKRLDTSDASHVAEPSTPKEESKPDAIKEAGKKVVKAEVEDDDEQDLPF
jgi:hypothetical protein